MDETLHQLGTLLLGSVPTIFLFIGLLFAYRFLVYGPLTRTLAERRARTAGAVEQAEAATAAAAAKTQEYETLLRAARGKIFEARQQKLQTWNQEKDAAITEAREAAQQQVTEAKTALQAQIHSEQRTLEDSIEALAQDVLHAILPRGRAAAGGTR